MTARAEGFWWVTGDSVDGPWCSIVHVRRGGDVVGLDTAPTWDTVAEYDADPHVEWGPYLGKEPNDPEAAYVAKLERVASEPVDHYPERNSAENRLIENVADGWDLVWWECIKPGDLIRYGRFNQVNRGFGLAHQMAEGIAKVVDIPGRIIRFGDHVADPTCDTMAWQRKRSVEETPTP